MNPEAERSRFWIKRVGKNVSAFTKKKSFFLFSTAAVSTLALTWLVTFYGLANLRYQKGDVASTRVQSPVDYSVEDPLATKALREEAYRQVPLFYITAPEKVEEGLRNIQSLIHDTREWVQGGPRPGNVLTQLIKLTGTVWSREDLAAARDLDWDAFEVSVISFLKARYEKCTVLEILPLDWRRREFALRDGVTGKFIFQGKWEVLGDRLVTLEDLSKDLLKQETSLLSDHGFLRPFLKVSIGSRLPVEARFDGATTQAQENEVASSLRYIQLMVKKNERIVEKGEVVTGEALLKLQGLEKKTLFLNRMAAALLLLLALGLASVYCEKFRADLFSKRRYILLFFTMVLLFAVVAKMLFWQEWPGVEYGLPLAAAPLLLTLLLGFDVALVAGVLMTVLTALMTNFAVGPTLSCLLMSFAAALAGKRIRHRNDLVRTGFLMSVANLLVIFTLYLMGTIRSSSGDITGIMMWGSFNGLVFCSMLALFLLSPVENIFKVLSDIRLLELSDLNHHLLKTMVLEAPGTYHHSLVVGTLAEAASERVGANPLLARVGSYFHDIGKSPQSEYFTENQRGGKSKHQDLSPYMSAIVIQNHVKQGVEIAQAAKLPEAIIDFIPQHQGTTLIHTFYQQAVEQLGTENVSAEKFRYSGPKPQSKEAAIVMLADSVESASRTIKEPSHQRFEHLVQKIVAQKMAEGQFDECDLTLKDLKRISESFVWTLDAIHHPRISYPDDPARGEMTNAKAARLVVHRAEVPRTFGTDRKIP